MSNRHDTAFTGSLNGDIATLRLERGFLHRTTDLDARDRIIDYLDHVSQQPEIKAVILMGAPDSLGHDEFIAFFKRINTEGRGEIDLHRMYNVISQLVVKIADLDKFVLNVNSGYVIGPFLNMGLACDYRLFADNTVIQNPSVELGMVPKGGSGYFLPRLLGRAKAYDVMLSNRDICAKEALQMGLINEVVPFEVIDRKAIERAREFIKKPASSLVGVKKLLNYPLQDLIDYLEYESQLLIKIFRKGEFWNLLK
jgi:2-(1,2-epoxy-1,2-dihydrophenyl)acetyl-CoA isomerase